MKRLAAALLLLVTAACGGLPVEGGVQRAGRVTPEQTERGAIQVLPPGPRAGADAREVVLGFLGAETSPDDRHALAREFLDGSTRAEWDDRSGAVVYDPTSLDVTPSPTEPDAVVVRAVTVASIGADGGYVLTPGTTEDTYRLRRDDRDQLRLVDVPNGLRLTPAGAARSFRADEVFFLGGGDRTSTQLVPDRVFLPVTSGPDELVRRLLAGPTSALRGAVTTSFPAGTEVRRSAQLRDGVLSVDLTGGIRSATGDQRQRLAAQLVWTLLEAVPTATRVRLLVDGRPFRVPGAGELQDRGDWLAFDPEGTAGRGGVLFVADRRLVRLDGTPVRSEVGDGRLPVDAVASAPASGRLAVLTRGTSGVTVRLGGLAGPFVPAVERGAVTSLSWGSGERGLWVVAAGADEPDVLLVPDTGTAPGPAQEISYVRPTGAGPLSVLRISRDGARAAAVFGEGTARRLYVGRVESDDAGLRLAGMRAIAPSLSDVADVAWESGTSLVALAPLGTPNRLPVRLAVDGSQVEPVRTLGLDGEPETLAAAPERPLVVGAVVAGKPSLLVEEDGLFRLQGPGAAPAYPG